MRRVVHCWGFMLETGRFLHNKLCVEKLGLLLQGFRVGVWGLGFRGLGLRAA